MNQAKFYLEKKDYAKAETAFIAAKKPESAIKMYADMANYPEAIRVAKKHAPHLVSEINARFVHKNEGSMTPEEIVASAKLWEESRDWRKAIDTYLEITKEHFQNADILQEIWEKAVHLAMNHDKERYHEVISIVAKRLRDIKRFEAVLTSSCTCT
jgi:intraflagellar transport protein 172